MIKTLLNDSEFKKKYYTGAQIFFKSKLPDGFEKQKDLPPNPASEEVRRRLSEFFGKAAGKLLSEIIIEERGVS